MQLLICATRRDEVLQAARSILAVRQQDKAAQCRLLISDQAKYQSFIEAIFSYYQIPLAMEGEHSLGSLPIWGAWMICSNFLLRLQESQPVLGVVRELLAIRLLSRPPKELQNLQQRLDSMRWDSSWEKLKPLLPEFQTLPFIDNWRLQLPEHRQALLNWLQQVIPSNPAIAELYQLLGESTGENIESRLLLAQLSRRVRQTMTRPMAILPLNDAIKISDFSEALKDNSAQHSDDNFDEKSHLWLLGCSREDVRKFGEQKLKHLIQGVAPSSDLHLSASLLDTDGSKLTPLQMEGLGISRSSETPINLTSTVSSKEKFLSDLPESLSASAIAQYALCPYRYFSRYQLRLDEKPAATPWNLPADKLGELIHKVFELKLPQLVAGGALEEHELQTIINDFFPQGWQGIFQQLDWQSLQRPLLEALSSEVEFIQKHRLKLLRTEVPLHFDLNLPTGEDGPEMSITIRCRIDRIDLLQHATLLASGGEEKDKPLVFVADYKSRSSSVSPQDRLQMIDLVQPQLPIYLLAIQKQGEFVAAGAMEIRVRSGKRGGLVRQELAKEFKSDTFEKLSAEEFLPAFELRLKNLLQQLFSGLLSPAPKDPKKCGFGNCPYWNLCRYDLADEKSATEDSEEGGDAAYG